MVSKTQPRPQEAQDAFEIRQANQLAFFKTLDLFKGYKLSVTLDEYALGSAVQHCACR